MVIRTSVVLAVLVFCGLLCVYAADVSGKWTAEFESGVGPQKYMYELKVENGKITGKASVNVGGTDMESKITEGTVEGDNVSCVAAAYQSGVFSRHCMGFRSWTIVLCLYPGFQVQLG